MPSNATPPQAPLVEAQQPAPQHIPWAFHQLSSASADSASSPRSGNVKVAWEAHEDRMLLKIVATMGTVWPVVAAKLPGRSADSVRNRYHRLRQLSRSLPDNIGGEAISENLLEAAGHLLAAGRNALAPAAAGAEAAALAAAATAPSASSHVPGYGARPSFPLAPAQDTTSGVPTSVPAACASDTAPSEPVPTRDPSWTQDTMLAELMPSRACWTKEEDRLIAEGVQRFGYKWRLIAATLKNRSDSSVRNRWTRIRAEAEVGLHIGGALHRQRSSDTDASDDSSRLSDARASGTDAGPAPDAETPLWPVSEAARAALADRIEASRAGSMGSKASIIPQQPPELSKVDSTAAILMGIAQQTLGR